MPQYVLFSTVTLKTRTIYIHIHTQTSTDANKENSVNDFSLHHYIMLETNLTTEKSDWALHITVVDNNAVFRLLS